MQTRTLKLIFLSYDFAIIIVFVLLILGHAGIVSLPYVTYQGTNFFLFLLLPMAILLLILSRRWEREKKSQTGSATF